MLKSDMNRELNRIISWGHMHLLLGHLFVCGFGFVVNSNLHFSFELFLLGYINREREEEGRRGVRRYLRKALIRKCDRSNYVNCKIVNAISKHRSAIIYIKLSTIPTPHSVHACLSLLCMDRMYYTIMIDKISILIKATVAYRNK